MINYVRTSIDDWLFTPTPFDGSKESKSVDQRLDRSTPEETAPEPSNDLKISVWEVFRENAADAWRKSGAQFFTVTMHSQLKYKNKFVIKAPPDKQARWFKAIVKDLMSDYEKNIKHPIHYYIFFEYSKVGALHCHGIAYCEGEVIFSYPYYSYLFRKLSTKHGFKIQGIHCEAIKSFGDTTRYISKDKGKHPILPIYG